MSNVTPIYLTWLNYLGGFEYFYITAKKSYNINLIETGQSRNNILPQWPKSYDRTADTIDKQTYRIAKNTILVRTQNLTANQRDALLTIRSSPLVQIMEARNDKRTVIVDEDSFKVYDEQDAPGIYAMQFTITYTDEIPSQNT